MFLHNKFLCRNHFLPTDFVQASLAVAWLYIHTVTYVSSALADVLDVRLTTAKQDQCHCGILREELLVACSVRDQILIKIRSQHC